MIKKVSGIIFAAALCCLTLSAQNRVSVFKNGTAFIQKADTLGASNGVSIMTDLPNALYGTFWVNSPTAAISKLRALPQVKEQQIEFANFTELLKANKGKKVRLVLAYQEPLEAVIQDVVNNFAFFKAADRWISTDISKIETLEFFDEPNLRTTSYEKGLEISWNNNKSSQQVSLMYVTKGIGWMPEYLIELNNETEARITLKANLINDADDITNSELNFVAGVPQFSFPNTESPLTSQQNLEQLLRSMNLVGGGDAGIMMKNVAMDMGSQESMQGYQIDATGSQAEDLYFYNIKNVSLPKGGRAAYAILETTSPVKHIYSVNIPQNNIYPYAQTGEGEGRTHTVFHAIELKNSSKHPWTTGSAFVVKPQDGRMQPLAQSKLNYTSKGSETQVRLSEAPDVQVKDKEQETSRVQNNRQRDGIYEDVTVDGEVTLKNYKAQEITIEVTRSIIGEPVKSNLDWETGNAVSYNPYNRLTNVTWTLTLKPNEERKIEYSYKYLVRR